MDRTALRFRAEVLEAIRRFFRTHDYLEVDTPVLSPSLIPEPHLEVFQTDFLHPGSDPRRLFLVPSPEIWMKRLLARGSGSIFQLCKSFRNYESVGAHHNPEFTMLEWYTVGHDYMDSMERTESFLHGLSAFDTAGVLRWPFHRISMTDAFHRWARIPLRTCDDVAGLRAHGARVGVTVPEDATWEEAFNRIFLARVEPYLPTDRPVFLYDYPARIPVLAQPGSDRFFAQRWELYVNGVELANCFTEETDLPRLRLYFREETVRKQRGTVPHPVAQDLPEVFSQVPEPTSGVALGVDRLVALLSGTKGIEGVIMFSLSSILR
jgi:elongation factor P--(R)-beta-lysine ligase